eukprot:scaffold124303_cov33-Phaeocystis_antarctica.AAC.2
MRAPPCRAPGAGPSFPAPRTAARSPEGPYGLQTAPLRPCRAPRARRRPVEARIRPPARAVPASLYAHRLPGKSRESSSGIATAWPMPRPRSSPVLRGLQPLHRRSAGGRVPSARGAGSARLDA